MSLSRRRMMYGLVGLAGMTRNLTALHAHHHAPRFGKRAVQASLAASGAMADNAPGVSGQGDMKFKVLYTSDHLPPEAQKVLVNAHGGFAVDRRPGTGGDLFRPSRRGHSPDQCGFENHQPGRHSG